MATNSEIKRLLESIALNGSINLNLDIPSKECRELWQKLVKLGNWIVDYAPKISWIEIPMVDFTSDEKDILLGLSTLENLKCCSLSGGRRGKEGQKLKGGINTLPAKLLFSTTVTSLDLSFNCLTAIPGSFENLCNLKTLMLDFNDIEILSYNFSKLNSLEELYLRNNKIKQVNESLQYLQKLKVLTFSSNKLTELPNVFHFLLDLVHFDVSNNQIKRLPASIFESPSLKKLLAGHNHLTDLSVDVISSGLDVIDMRYNCIADVCVEIKRDSRILLEGNSSQKCIYSSSSHSRDYDVENTLLDSDIAEICVNSIKGASFTLPSGVKIVIPNNMPCHGDGKIYCNVNSNETTNFKLNPTDQLLSVVLELTPNGLRFWKPLRISVPFCYEQCDRQAREIVMRVTTVAQDGSFASEDLKSTVNMNGDGNPNHCSGDVTAFVDHFSIFGVVSRLIEDSTVVNDSVPATLFSTVNNINRLHFPQCSVSSPTNVTIRVLSVGQNEVKSVVNTNYCPVSDVLDVTVNPYKTFLFPITVHLALPSQLVGCPYDKNNLRLIKCPKDTSEWHDITGDVDLVFTTVDVSFQVDSFSKFWLVWRNVMGVARKVYQRVITYQVQFLAMQKKTLPSIVRAQCIREDLLQERINQLIDEGYCGKDAYTVVLELMEGDRYCIKVMGDLKVKYSSDIEKQHLEEKILLKRFHTQYPPEKSLISNFCIEPLSEGSQTVSGRISFYKLLESLCGVPESDQCISEKTADNKGPKINRQPLFSVELEHLDDVLITLEKLDSAIYLPEGVEHPLHFGELGTGMFKESNLRYIASEIGAEWKEIGNYLDIRTDCLERIELNHPGQTKEQIFSMLKKWSILHMHEKNCITTFTNALREADRTDLAEKVEKIYLNGVEKFKSTIKRSRGLNQAEEFHST